MIKEFSFNEPDLPDKKNPNILFQETKDKIDTELFLKSQNNLPLGYVTFICFFYNYFILITRNLTYNFICPPSTDRCFTLFQQSRHLFFLFMYPKKETFYRLESVLNRVYKLICIKMKHKPLSWFQFLQCES